MPSEAIIVSESATAARTAASVLLWTTTFPPSAQKRGKLSRVSRSPVAGHSSRVYQACSRSFAGCFCARGTSSSSRIVVAPRARAVSSANATSARPTP